MMQPSILANTVVPALLNGETGSAIADKVGCHKSTISRIKDKLKDQVEAFQLQLIQTAGRETVENISTTIGRAHEVLHDPTIKSKDLEDYKVILGLSHKKEALVGQSMGILPSRTQTTVINQIFNQQNTIISDVKVLAAIERYGSDNDIGIDLGLDGDDMLNIEDDK